MELRSLPAAIPRGPWRAIALAAAAALLAILIAGTWSRVERLETAVEQLDRSVSALRRTQDSVFAPISPLLLDYELDLPGRGEIFPTMVSSGAPEYWPVAILRVTNTANRPSTQTITAEIQGWSRLTEQSVVVGARETLQFPVQPELLPRAYLNQEIRQVTLVVRAVSTDGNLLYAESHPVLMHSGSEIFWGRKFANAQMAARWVTPHDPAVLDLIASSRAYIARGRMAGYNKSTGDSKAIARHVRAQAQAVFRALQKSGISYVGSLFVMGEYVGQAQRLRLPRETLHLKSANCMDVSLVFASAMENLGMEPLVIIVPGHAFAGVRLGPKAEDILFVDLTVLPRGSFENAIARAQSWIRKTPQEEVLTVDIASTRVLGVYPLVYEESPDTLSTLTSE
jgi:hypothetical protein